GLRKAPCLLAARAGGSASGAGTPDGPSAVECAVVSRKLRDCAFISSCLGKCETAFPCGGNQSLYRSHVRLSDAAVALLGPAAHRSRYGCREPQHAGSRKYARLL